MRWSTSIWDVQGSEAQTLDAHFETSLHKYLHRVEASGLQLQHILALKGADDMSCALHILAYVQEMALQRKADSASLQGDERS